VEWERGIVAIFGRRGTSHGSGLGVFRWFVERTGSTGFIVSPLAMNAMTANVVFGDVEIEGDTRTAKLRWADVPAGTTSLYGWLGLQLNFSIQLNRVTHMSAAKSSGQFGGSHWTWSAKWEGHLRSP